MENLKYIKKSNRDNNYRKYFDNKAKILVEKYIKGIWKYLIMF